MADYLEIYFGSPDDDTTTVATLATLLDVTFTSCEEPYATHQALDCPVAHGIVHYDLHLHEGLFTTDELGEDMPFSRMPHVLAVRGERHEEAAREALGRAIHQDLVELGYTPARLTYDSIPC